MGIFADIIDDMKDRDQYDGMNVGWSSISPKIKCSSRQKDFLSSLGLTAPNTIRDVGNIIFFKATENTEIKRGKIELVLNWKYMTEKRKNELMLLRRKMKFEGSKISIDSSLEELDIAHKNILEILSSEPDMSKTRYEHQEKDEEFLSAFCQELLLRLLGYIKNVNEEKTMINIVMDMKYLTAVVLNILNEEEYECSTYGYITYLQELGLKHQNIECKYCSIDVLFDDYKYCLACGKRK